jgi:hypothetical protein
MASDHATIHLSHLQQERRDYKPYAPSLIQNNHSFTLVPVKADPIHEDLAGIFPNLAHILPQEIKPSEVTSFHSEPIKVRNFLSYVKETKYQQVNFFVKIGVVLSGGPAAGGHNVICGLFDYLKAKNLKSKLIGFIGNGIQLIIHHPPVFNYDPNAFDCNLLH